MTRTQRQIIAVVCGMALYWGGITLGEGIVARRYPEPPTVGATMFLLALGPFAWMACGVVVLTAKKANRILWTCGAGAMAAVASLAVVSC